MWSKDWLDSNVAGQQVNEDDCSKGKEEHLAIIQMKVLLKKRST